MKASAAAVILGAAVTFCTVPARADSPQASRTNPIPFKNTGSGETFLRDLYSRYTKAEHQAPDVQGRDDAALLDLPLLVLSRKERKLANYEVGAFDADPICDCQDWDKVIVENVSVSDVKPDRVTATVMVKMDTQYPVSKIRYDLVRIQGRWRIHNIFYAENERNMVSTLKKFIREGA